MINLKIGDPVRVNCKGVGRHVGIIEVYSGKLWLAVRYVKSQDLFWFKRHELEKISPVELLAWLPTETDSGSI